MLDEVDAIERIASFCRRFGINHWYLAYHAAFPQRITPELLTEIRERFVHDSHWGAISDLLLSRLFQEVGYELYEMDVTLRNILLHELISFEKYGKRRLVELANFYLEWVSKNPRRVSEKGFTHPSVWIPLILGEEPTKHLNYHLAIAIQSGLQKGDLKELFRLAMFAENTPPVLVDINPLLLTYCKGLHELVVLSGGVECALKKFKELVDQGYTNLNVFGVNLPILERDTLEKLLNPRRQEVEEE